MKIILYTLFLGVALPVCAELPGKSADLIKKLNDWELEEQIELQQRMFKKRSEVVVVLRSQFESANESGDLGGAVAIMKEIERLTTSMEAGGATSESKRKRWSETDVEGTLWRSPNGMFWELEKDGIINRSGKATIDRWSLSGRGILTIYFGGFNGSGKIDLELDSEMTRGIGEINGEEKTFVRLNKTASPPE